MGTLCDTHGVVGLEIPRLVMASMMKKSKSEHVSKVVAPRMSVLSYSVDLKTLESIWMSKHEALNLIFQPNLDYQYQILAKSAF
jgi:hypothetical protein